ncbi:MAG: nuclear transport factor 2 family protein [Parafilimonas sp.]
MRYQQLIIQAYKNFNNRNIDAVFESMKPDVSWPNGWEGGHIKGFSAIRDYWTRQWMELDPIVIPAAFRNIGKNKIEVEVQQVVKDKTGKLLFEGLIKHIYTFEGGLIKSMKIKQSEN